MIILLLKNYVFQLNKCCQNIQDGGFQIESRNLQIEFQKYSFCMLRK